MAVEDREFGILIAKVEGIGQQLVEMRAANTAEHATTSQRLNTIEESLHVALARKADLKAVETHERRIDSLESDRDKRLGGQQLVRFLQGIAVTAATVGAFLVGAAHF